MMYFERVFTEKYNATKRDRWENLARPQIVLFDVTSRLIY